MRQVSHYVALILIGWAVSFAHALAADDFLVFSSQSETMPLVNNSSAKSITYDASDYKGIVIAINNLQKDIEAVTGQKFSLSNVVDGKCRILVGSIDQSAPIKKLIKAKKIKESDLKGKIEKYIITSVADASAEGGEILVIAGSDMRGTIYGIYELSRQMGVSPWYWWADVPTDQHAEVYFKRGVYTDGEPTVRYRGIFLNDEAPCLTSWAKMSFPDEDCPSANKTARGFNHHFYGKVFELLLRLKANYMWPAMWGNAFYADDPMNSVTANEMGIMMGTSHHEPMARNHQEWARNRAQNGPWDYDANQEVIDKFFREGIERSKGTEDIITIGMRGDGDTPMGGKEGQDDQYVNQDQHNIQLLERIIKNQRKIIKDVTGKAPEKTQQVWAIYKEVQRFYDLGLQVPDDVLILLSDDNWGNVRRVPTEKVRNRKGGWGMYYHVDYVGAPRCTRWQNVTPVSHLWEQLYLTYTYGIDRMWILNVGDLKPMEYPISFFLDMAWNPQSFQVDNFEQHAVRFCTEVFGESQAQEAARILLTYCKYNGRVTPEMLNSRTYNVNTGEFAQVTESYKALEAEALRQYMTLEPQYRAAYYQLVLFPVQAMANLYEMYYAVAMNRHCYEAGNPDANMWADKVEACFARDKKLNDEYNHELSGGKWNHFMDEVHIGYTAWNTPRENKMPIVKRLDNASDIAGGYVFEARNGVVSMEAEHFYSVKNANEVTWTKIPNMGRTKSAMAPMPYAKPLDGASISYKMQLPADVKQVKVHVVTNSTLPFERTAGHRFVVSLADDKANADVKNSSAQEVNYNGKYNEDNQWEMYDVVATRVIESVVTLDVKQNAKEHILTIQPLDAGLVIEKVVVDCGGYEKSHLFMDESPCRR